MTDEMYVSSGQALDIKHAAWVLTVFDDSGTVPLARVGRRTDAVWAKGSPVEVVVGLVAHEGEVPGITVLSNREDDESITTYTAFRPFTQSEAGRLGVAIDRVTAGGGL